MHIGRNIYRLRNYRGLKQQDIAKRLKMTQQNYSLIENSDTVDDELLNNIANILGYEADFIKHLPETPHVYSTHQQGGNVIYYDVSSTDKIVKLYEQVLETERKRIKMLEELLKSMQEAGKKK